MFLIFPCCCRGNLKKRLVTLDGQLEERKGRIKLQKVFVKRKKRILNQLQPKKKCRDHKFHDSPGVRRRDILDSQTSLGLLASQESHPMSQLHLSLTPSQESQRTSPLGITLSPPCLLSPMCSLEMSPLTQTSPPPSSHNTFGHRRTNWQAILSPEAGTKWNKLCDNISVALAVVAGKHSLSREEISAVADNLHAAQRIVEQIGATKHSGYLQTI